MKCAGPRLRRLPQCGEFFSRTLASEPWMNSFQRSEVGLRFQKPYVKHRKT